MPLRRLYPVCFSLFACGTTDLEDLEDAGASIIDTGVTSDGSLGDVGPIDSFVADSGGVDVGFPDTGEVPDSGVITQHFSFFVTSLRAIQVLAPTDQGFGGDLTFGETGMGAGLRGADKICAAIADMSLPGASSKQWRAFLSANQGDDGNPVNAIDRVGEGPWYDRLGRVVALNKNDLIAERPLSADPVIFDDLPNEDGVPNHRPDPTMGQVDNHDTLTGSNDVGELYGQSGNCLSWTSNLGDRATEGRPRVGHSWPRRGGPGGGGGGGPGGMNMAHWISSLDESGCAPGVAIVERGPPLLTEVTVGSGGGYGGFYCFALVP